MLIKYCSLKNIADTFLASIIVMLCADVDRSSISFVIYDLTYWYTPLGYIYLFGAENGYTHSHSALIRYPINASSNGRFSGLREAPLAKKRYIQCSYNWSDGYYAWALSANMNISIVLISCWMPHVSLKILEHFVCRQNKSDSNAIMRRHTLVAVAQITGSLEHYLQCIQWICRLDKRHVIIIIVGIYFHKGEWRY